MPPCPTPCAGTTRLNPHRLSSRTPGTGVVSHLADFLLPLPCRPMTRNKTARTQTHSQQARALQVLPVLAHCPPDGSPDTAARAAFRAEGHLQCQLGQAARL